MKAILLHKNDLTQFDRRDNVVKAFESRLDTVILTPNYNDGNFDHKIGPIYLKKEVYEESNRAFSSERFGLYYRQHYKGFEKRPILFDGYDVTFDFFYIPKGDDHDFMSVGEYLYIKPIASDFFKFKLQFNYTNNDTYLTPKVLGGNEGQRGYDRESLPTQWNMGAMVQFQKNLFKCYFSSIFLEYNRFKLIKPVYEGETLSESTVGINASYYFSEVSIPGIIVELGHNIDDQSNHVIINVGLSL